MFTNYKNSWKYILIIIILAVIVSSGILNYNRRMEKQEIKVSEQKESEKVVEPEKIEKEKMSELTAYTDKTEYISLDPNEKITIYLTVENNSDKSICFGACNTYSLLRKKDNDWEEKDSDWEEIDKNLCETEWITGCIKPRGTRRTFNDVRVWEKGGTYKFAIPIYFKEDLSNYPSVINEKPHIIYSREFEVKGKLKENPKIKITKENLKLSVGNFCSALDPRKEPWEDHYYFYGNFDQDKEEELFVACMGDEGYSPFYLLKGKGGVYDKIIWEKDFSEVREVHKPEVIDVDKDGINEILISYANWGGTCTGGENVHLLYSPKYNEEFEIVSSEGDYYTPSTSSIIIDQRLVLGGCTYGNGIDLDEIYLSGNLRDSKYQVFKDYLENKVMKVSSGEVPSNSPLSISSLTPEGEKEFEEELEIAFPSSSKWKLYRSPLGFEIRYPSDLFLNEKEKYISTAKPEELLPGGILPKGHSKISFDKTKDYQSIDDFISKNFASSTNRIITNIYDITFEGYNSIYGKEIDYTCKSCEEQYVPEAKISLPGTKGAIVLFPLNDDSIIYFWLSTYYDDGFHIRLENILLTLRFLKY